MNQEKYKLIFINQNKNQTVMQHNYIKSENNNPDYFEIQFTNFDSNLFEQSFYEFLEYYSDILMCDYEFNQKAGIFNINNISQEEQIIKIAKMFKGFLEDETENRYDFKVEKRPQIQYLQK